MKPYISIFGFILSVLMNFTIAFGQTDKEWLEIGKGMAAINCYKSKYTEYNLIKIVDKRPDWLPAQLLTNMLGSSERYKSYYKSVDHYLKLVMDNQLYNNEVILEFSNEMTDKQFLVAYGKFSYLLQVKFYMHKYLINNQKKAPNDLFVKSYEKITTQIDTWITSVEQSRNKAKNIYTNDKNGCLGWRFIQNMRNGMNADRSIQASIQVENAKEDHEKLVTLLKGKKYIIERSDESAVWIDVSALNLAEVKNLIDLILANHQPYFLMATAQIEKEKSRVLTFGDVWADNYRNLPFVRLFSDEEKAILNYSSNKDINKETFKTKVNGDKLFSIAIGFPNISDLRTDIRLIYYYSDCKNLKELPKETGTTSTGGTIIKYYDKFSYEMECSGINVSDIEQASLHIANIFEIQYYSIEKQIEERNKSKEYKPFARGNKVLAYPYIMGQVTNTRNLDEEKAERIAEYWRGPSSSSNKKKQKSYTVHSEVDCTLKVAKKREDNSHVSIGTIELDRTCRYKDEYVSIKITDANNRTKTISKYPVLAPSEIFKAPVHVEISYRGNCCSGCSGGPKVLSTSFSISENGNFDIHVK